MNSICWKVVQNSSRCVPLISVSSRFFNSTNSRCNLCFNRTLSSQQQQQKSKVIEDDSKSDQIVDETIKFNHEHVTQNAIDKQENNRSGDLDVVEDSFRRVVKISDIPKHQLPVKDIVGSKEKEAKVWWDSEMNRPSIRERVWQADPIIQYSAQKGLGKLRTKRYRTIKSAHIKSLDETFVEAYEQIGANKEAFELVCNDFKKKSLRGWGFMEFQYVAMEYMKAFNVSQDVECYNQLLQMYPRGPLRQTNYFAEALQLGIMEQNAAIDLINRMVRLGSAPDINTLHNLVDIFGPRSEPVKLVTQYWYWLPKLRNLNPWPLPDPFPTNPIDTAKLLLERISDYDQEYDVLCGSYETADVDSAYLVSAMNEEQSEQLANLPHGSVINVTGPFLQYFPKKMSHYCFVLRGEPPSKPVQPNTDEIEFHPEDYEEGYVYATSVTGQPDLNMARLWINELAKKHNNIENLFVSFNLTGHHGSLEVCDESSLETVQSQSVN